MSQFLDSSVTNTSTNTPLAQLQDINVVFDKKAVLKNINLTIFANTILTIVGPNGGGKSTLLKVLLQLIKPTGGKVVHAPNLVLGYVPQRFHLEPSLPITVQRFLTFNKKISAIKLNDILTLLSINHLTQQSIHKLSGGEMQRVLLGRAILNRPNLLVLDEPMQGVDINGQAELYQLINQARQLLNCAVLMVSHDLHLVMKNTDQVLCINQHICCAGSPEKISNDPHFIHLFGAQFTKNFALYTHHHNHHHSLGGDEISVSNEKPNKDL